MNKVKVTRSEYNPILRPADIKPGIKGMVIECLLNPGVFRFEGKTWLLLRVAERPVQEDGFISFPVIEDGEVKIVKIESSSPELDMSDPRVINYHGEDYLTTMSHLRLVCSDDGERFYEPEGYAPIFGHGECEGYGIEDCRVAQIEDRFYLTYTAVSKHGVAVGLMTTSDWKHFERPGLILPPHNKDCALFESRLDDIYYMLHRPSSPELGGNYIWIASSPDLRNWGGHKCIAHSREGMWDSARVGAGAAPILTDKGWLVIYHGANSDNRYCLGAILLDRKDPSKLLARSIEPIMYPEEDYELTGFFGNVIFTNGHVVDSDRITIYYGASDEVICKAEMSINEILESLE